MGENTRIEWATHTFNPWWGCTKVSEACKHCYAESWAKRLGQQVWGPKVDRRMFSDEHWKQPFRWNRKAAGDAVRPRVFCASMADVFEDRQELITARVRLWDLIEATPNLDWLLLTKRPENVARLAGWGKQWPANVWLGTTVELQKRAEELLPFIAASSAQVKFISAEPLLGPLQLQPWLSGDINWVITGGESGPKARLASPAWFRSLLLQCMENQVAFHFKQWGDWAPGDGVNLPAAKVARADDGTTMVRVGKKAAGRALDGAEWSQLPSAACG
ncbi:phage Gp37/Gp68 family protein [Paracoccus sp. YLB-12]|uniref:Phage Gp37/Gp68 family protein n=1 Tax=Paracoccus maritimus TaxID=2933292 RepID=A0ABT2KDL9_9RHOB|nr:phage Gp37/Gp68 family protein [Paracoccus sp. YLB-12]MCT4334647.1 phage Gp37/Gp68 family protein [Paracoccus sp. YLB-12]